MTGSRDCRFWRNLTAAICCVPTRHIIIMLIFEQVINTSYDEAYNQEVA